MMNNQTAISIIDSDDANSSNHRIDHRHKHRRHHHQHHNLPRRIKRRSKISNKTLGKFLGFTFLLLILVAMFIAIRGRHNEMMYVALTFTIFSIALFSYGYWSAVNRGDGIWQYIGPTNLQHQQMSNPNYHFDPIHPEQQQQLSSSMKNNPNIRSYMVAPPKMGGVRLNIFTIGDDDKDNAADVGGRSSSTISNSPPCPSPNYHQQQQFHSKHNHHSHHHRNHHHHHHHHHKQHSNRIPKIDSDGDGRNTKLNGKNNDNHNDDNDSIGDPIKCLVQLPSTLSSSSLKQQQTSGNYSLNENADFTEVILPDRKSKSNHSISQSN